MKPKFKINDYVKYDGKKCKTKFIEQIIDIKNNKYTIRHILPVHYLNCIADIDISRYECNTENYTEVTLLTDEDKLELL